MNPFSSPGVMVAVAAIVFPSGEHDGSNQLYEASPPTPRAVHEPSEKSSSDLWALT
jgi:hypothetical protein